MSGFHHDEWFEVEHCYKCGMAFAMTADFQRRRRNDHQTFYCPAGHGQHYSGATEAQKLRQQLDAKERELSHVRDRAATVEAKYHQVSKAHKKMRERVANGVCPCCNRTFQNLRQHMQSEHPDFGQARTMFAVRTAFGMTQAAVGQEAGVDTTYVSLYERDKRVPERAKRALDNWLEFQAPSDGGGQHA